MVPATEECPGCGHKIGADEALVSAMGHDFHAKCFSCAECKRPIEGDFHPEGNKPWCPSCYLKVKASKCWQCGEGIIGKIVKLDERHFHEECAKLATQGTCEGCKKSIGLLDPVVEALGKIFHKGCFRCTKCGMDINGDFVVESDGSLDPVCNNCADGAAGSDPGSRRSSKVTAEVTELTITGKDETPTVVIDATNGEGHEGLDIDGTFNGGDAVHERIVMEVSNTTNGDTNRAGYPEELQAWFKQPPHRPTNVRVSDGNECGLCGDEITGGTRLVANGKRFHETCFEKAYSGECYGCKKKLALNEESFSVSKLGRDWHRECLRCAECEGLIEGPFRIHAGSPTCTDCFVEKRAPVCAACDRKITDKIVKALNTTWHLDCFVCEGCREPLAEHGTRYFNYKGKPYCEKDMESSRVRVAY